MKNLMTAPTVASGLRATLVQVAEVDRLRAAWADILATDLDDGMLSTGVSRFAEDADKNLANISAQLLSGEFEPARLTPVSLPRPDGRARVLHIPTVRDRIVERSVLAVVTPIIDPWLGPFSYAYRPGLGVADAVQAVAALRDEGLKWVARADFHDCFARIPLPRLLRVLPVLLDDAALLDLIQAFLARRPVSHDRRRGELAGLPQGSPLSPLWANFVLADFDTRVVTEGYPLIRYSDDIVALTADRNSAQEAMRTMNEAAANLGMTFGSEKGGVMSFDEGFTFLGEDFGPRYPPALPGHRMAEPSRRVVYLGLQGSHARLNSGRLVVESAADVELLSVPSGLVDRLVCFGAVGISAGLRSWALASDVDLVFLSRRGTYLGHAWPAAGGRRLARLRAQLSVADDADRALRFARAVVSAKAGKQKILLQRLARRDNHETVLDAVRQIDHLLTMLADCATRNEVMGIEGAAAHAYFVAVGEVVPQAMRFNGRSRHLHAGSRSPARTQRPPQPGHKPAHRLTAHLPPMQRLLGRRRSVRPGEHHRRTAILGGLVGGPRSCSASLIRASHPPARIPPKPPEENLAANLGKLTCAMPHIVPGHRPDCNARVRNNVTLSGV